MRNTAPKDAPLVDLGLFIPASAPNKLHLGQDAVNVGCVHMVAQQHQWNPGNLSPPRNSSLNTFGSLNLFDSTGFSNAVSLEGLGQQPQFSGATVNNQGSIPLSGTQIMGGGWVSEKLNKPEAHIAAILGMVSLLVRLRLMERSSVSNLLKLIPRHQIFFYNHQSLPQCQPSPFGMRLWVGNIVEQTHQMHRLSPTRLLSYLGTQAPGRPPTL